VRVKLFNRFWEVSFVPRLQSKPGKKGAKSNVLEEDDRGECDPPTVKNKQIRIANDLPPEEELEVTIHEALHACDWYKDEEWVEITARDIAKMLYRKLGWRRVLEREE